MLKRLEQKKVPIEKINIKANKQQSIKDQLQNMCFKDPELKYLGQKAFISYVKSIHVQKDKEVFNLKELQIEDYAASLGLPGAPRIKFIKGDDTKDRKNAPRGLTLLSSDEDSGSEDTDGKKKKKSQRDGQVRTRYDRMFERQNQGVLTDHYSKLINDDGTMAGGNTGGDDNDEADDFLSVKRRFRAGDEALDKGTTDDMAEASTGETEKDVKRVQLDGTGELAIDSKRREKLLKSKKKLLKYKGKGTKLVYDEDGNAHELYEMEDEEKFKARGDADVQRAKFMTEEAERTRKADIEDKELAKQKRREKKEKRKALERGNAIAEEEADDSGVQLAHAEEKPIAETEDDGENEEETQPRKKSKTKKQQNVPENVETMEDLETLASGLLGQ